MIKTRPSKGCRTIFLFRKRELKMYRQNRKEEQISLFEIVEQKADLSSSNGRSIQLYLPPCAFLQFCIRESSRRGIWKLG